MYEDTTQRLQTILMFLFKGTKSNATVELVSDNNNDKNYIYLSLKEVKDELLVTEEEIAILLYNDLIEADSGYGLGTYTERETYQLTDAAVEKIDYILQNFEQNIALPE